ncbi:hypothetical protein M569_12850 [Genlisea aurea]|uniref:Uncharacterized protein n=1 Tax=Genlisea aurea TaxID=192259 RepID=S8CC23_9LAMI|nr:hypothetical protein M569_12850 [Genlisea aurea]
MEVNSVEKLCEFFISCAFRRCILSDDFCRLSVFLTPVSLSMIRISVSDTGCGTELDEFQDVYDAALLDKWDGVLSIATTSVSDDEINHMRYDSKEIDSSRRASRIGTEVTFSASEHIDHLATAISIYMAKMLVLQAPKIAMELIVGNGRVILRSSCVISVANADRIDHLKLGLESYVSKHGNRLTEACNSCFPIGKKFRFGAGTVRLRGKRRSGGGQVMDIVIILSEVLYLRDFSPCSLPQTSVVELTNMQWKKYGLDLKSVSEHDGVILLEWQNLPPDTRIDMAIHTYNKQLKPVPRISNHMDDGSLTKRALKRALNDLKAKNQHALKIQRYAPDLARTISSLIFSSNDENFQAQCLSLMGLGWGEHSKSIVEDCIKNRIVSVIDVNPSESASLFADDEED